MEIVPIISIVFTFIFLIIILENIFDERKRKMKIEAALREAEMERGYAPGTYSRSFSSKKAYKEFTREMKRRKKNGKNEFSFRNEKEERDALEKGIRDLEKRIENIDLIMKKRNKRTEGKND